MKSMNLRRNTNSGFTLPMLRERASTLPMPRERSTLRSRRAIVPPSRDEGGFTLVELMIAAAITVVIVLVLGGMFLSLTNTSMRASQRIDAFRDARAALQTMERDMANLVQLPSTLPTPTPTPPTSAAPAPLKSAAYFALDNVWQDPNDPYSANTGSLNRQVFALIARSSLTSSSSTSPTPTPTPTSGDLSAVGYYCRWDTDHYVLCRFFRDSATTFAAMQSNPGTYVPVATLYVPSPNDEVLAAYVWNFNVTLYDGTGAVISAYPYVCDPDAITINPLPAAAEISFNAMSPQAARTVMSVTSSPNDWMNTTTPNYQRLILPHMYQFRTRINLQ
jgi:type II secretory pathway pseudopilin PulG